MLDEDGALSDAGMIVIVADDADAAQAVEQIVPVFVALGTARSGWAEAATAVAAQPMLVAVFADAAGVPLAQLDDMLPVLQAAVAETGRRLVVAFDHSQLNTVGGLLLGTDAILLCEPDAVDRAAALAVARTDDGLMVNDLSRDGQRLQRLNEEVARIAETLARLTQRDAALGAPRVGGDAFVADRTADFHARPLDDIDPGIIRRAIRARRLRDDAFDLPGLFEDPAWDMLLDLFAAELERRRVSVSSLCIAAAVAPTTALRWIGKLMEAGLLDRRPDEFDRRRAFISLSARASTAMRNYVGAMRRAGLTLG